MILGMTNGCYDLLHDGHRFMLTLAAQQCDRLVVAVNSDRSIKSLKGRDRPFWTMAHRLAHLDELGKVILRQGGAPLSLMPFEGDEGLLVAAVRPTVYFRGYDQATEGETYCGVPVIKLPELAGYSTTRLAQEATP